MQEFGRAVYTRCYVGINFNSSISTQEGQQLFSTSGNKDIKLDKETVDILEKKLREDVFNAGNRSYAGDIYRFIISNEGISVLLYYRWLKKDETGSRELGLTKALYGKFDHHPMEYYSSKFFNSADYFYDYKDANGNKINEYKQLLTYKDSIIPPLFPIITKDILVGLLKKFPIISFDDTSKYVLQSNYVAERVSAAVCHLVKQFSLPENQRKGIRIKGQPDQIRYWIAAIGYAFSVYDAQKISFSVGLPPKQFPYTFSSDALTGWDETDSELEMVKSPPSNLVFLEDLPIAENDEYYKIITKYNATHHDFIFNYMRKHNTNINDYPNKYRNYIDENGERIIREKAAAEKAKADKAAAEKAKADKAAAEKAKAYKAAADEEVRKKVATAKKPETAFGKLSINNNAFYVGCFTNDTPNGWGIMYRYNGKYWKMGEWNNGYFSKGFIWNDDTSNNKSNIIKVAKPNPFSILGDYYALDNEVIYIGELLATEPHGWGAKYFPNGEWHIGRWENGKPHTVGVCRIIGNKPFFNDQILLGFWLNGEFNQQL